MGRVAIAGSRTIAAATLALAAWLAPGDLARAGPPYVTDDAEPTDLGHWEIYHFLGGVHIGGETDGEAGFDINYGAARDLQLTAVLPLAYQNWDAAGAGRIELAAKYRIVHQSEGGWGPDVAVFPRLFAPASSERFGSTHFSLLLPIWLQKDAGPWSVFGGGGYVINPGAGRRNFWISGAGATRTLGERWSVGAEVYYQGPDTDDAKGFTGLNVGATYRLTGHWTAMGSVGPGVQDLHSPAGYAFYAALEATY